MWSSVLILICFLMSMLHSGASFLFLRHQTEIENMFVKSRDIQEDWPCNLPKETKIAVCKELLKTHLFSEVLQLVYNKSYEQKGHKFECEKRPLWLVSKEYVRTKRFRGFQHMIMCPVCSKYSKTCFIANGIEDIDREVFTRRTFNNDKRNERMSFEEMVESRETFDFESNQYMDANDRFITSQQTHYSDTKERLSSGQLSSSVEEFDSEQKADSRQRRNLRQMGNFRQQVIPEETPDDTIDIDIDKIVHANNPRDVLDKVKLWQEANEKTSDVKRTIDTKPQIQTEHLNNPVVQVGSSPHVGPEDHITAEINIESPAHFPEEAEQSVSEQIGDFKQDILADKIPEIDQNTDIEHPVHNAHHNDVRQPVSHQEVDVEQLDPVGQHSDTLENTDASMKPAMAEGRPEMEESLRSNAEEQLVAMAEGKPETEENQHNNAEEQLTAMAEGSPETEKSQHSNAEEHLDTDKEVDLQQNENVVEKVDSAQEDTEQYANPEEELEEYYFSIDQRIPQSIFLYTWFKRGGYFTIYMHIIDLQTPILKPTITKPKVEEPFNMWNGPLHARPIQPYEPYDFLDEIEKNKVPSLVQKSNRRMEMSQFV